ncbi:MAG: transporter substrate-binding domain-containing protein [Atopobiaceae bacterium]|jgi:polar amino acid transport system substrate-binding protein|nr:transporter substrate-binding domain-containing protein [Atopobiaceae bacterium]MCH4119116.1 transporter substrate-binding domain-containing protein [Atopobiaceae bacterium]MCI1388625.1 transporter substrate-binding domain-containing protein [Atopobiaceae bacterium]MCI1432124.1 transporter substrate-binding domain-containing protein [Atopobiaceae bacterium]MCI1470582.1 transporter substrate-binding domain-containing protein [Atopobiaceae bacterium]
MRLTTTNVTRRSAITMLGGAAMLGLAACGSTSGGSSSAGSDAATTESASSDQLEPTSGMDFVVGFDQEYPPYGYVGDDGEYTGFDLDLAQRVCEIQGWNYQPNPIDWDAKDGELNGGSITCIWNGFTVEGRENDYTFSDPYMLNAQVIVVKADSGIKSFGDLAGKTVITQADSAALEVLQGDQADLAATFASLDTRADYNTAFMELESGAVDAVACDLSIAAYQLAQKPDTYVQLDDELSSEHYAVGFKKGNTDLAKAVTDTLKQMDSDGEVEKLCEKYSDQGISYSNWCLGK